MPARKLKIADNSISAKIMYPDQDFVLQIEPKNGTDLMEWYNSNREYVEHSLLTYGGILFRGFNVPADQFQTFVKLTSTEQKMLDYKAGTSPRKKTKEGVYNSTDFPHGLEIPQHHEMSYNTRWPRKIIFYCDVAPQVKGETPICSSRTFREYLDKKTFNLFSKQGVLYVRNYTDLIGAKWEQAFETSSRAEVEEFLKSVGIEYFWRPDGQLRTKHVAQGVAQHPATKEMVFLNQAHTLAINREKGKFSPWFKLLKEVLDEAGAHKLSTMPQEDLPFSAYFEDGSVIDTDILLEVKKAFDDCKVKFAWQKQDVLLLDNMLCSHGRSSFKGDRRILVGLTDMYDSKANKNSKKEAA